MKFGYARVSTPQQSLENQVALLKDAGCERIFSEKISGYQSVKGEFDKMMEFVRAKDVIVVTGVDRLGRSTKDLTILLEEFHNRELHNFHQQLQFVSNLQQKYQSDVQHYFFLNYQNLRHHQ